MGNEVEKCEEARHMPGLFEGFERSGYAFFRRK